MNKNVKIVVGANFGDESKGLMTRHFAKEAKLANENPIVVFHNGSAQRGHTVDYNPHFRHVYHHFGCGTGDGVPTFFASTFWIHPMEFYREYKELYDAGVTIPPIYYDPMARVVTPFDMLIDHATEAWIALQNGEREHGSCGYGTWCAIESRGEKKVYPVDAYIGRNEDYLRYILEDTWNQCVAVLVSRGVDIEQLPEYKEYFVPHSWKKKQLIEHFIWDIKFFLSHVQIATFENIYNIHGSLIFEGAQGLGLDKDCGKEWHTTSNTGLVNPYSLLRDKPDFTAEVCYVTRSYTTRHGLGEMGEEASKKEINEAMVDLTNVPNEFQGSLRYGYPENKDMELRIVKDFSVVEADTRFKKSMAITHCNEFPDIARVAEYMSNNPYTVINRT